MASTLLAGKLGQRLVAGARELASGHPRLLKSLSWRGFVAFFAFAVALSAWTWSGLLLMTKTLTFAEHADFFLGLLQRNLLHYLPIYLLVAFADALPLQGRRRNAALVTALVAGVLLAVQVRCAVSPNAFGYVGGVQTPYCSSFPTWRTYFDFYNSSVITPLTIAAMVMVFVFGRRRDAQLLARLYKARAAKLEARRRRIESDIASMQSRVDSDALFARLREIRGAYDRDPDGGEAMLDHLIGELRAAAQEPAPA